MDNIDDLLDWLGTELARDTAAALNASASDLGATLAGEHWQWVDPVTDEVVPVDALPGYVDRTLSVPHGSRVSLRSVEEYETRLWPDGPHRYLPSFPVYYAEEVNIGAAAHIVEWAPARVLRQLAAQQAVVGALRAAVAHARAVRRDPSRAEGYAAGHPRLVELEGLERAVRELAVAYADRPGYQPSWRP